MARGGSSSSATANASDRATKQREGKYLDGKVGRMTGWVPPSNIAKDSDGFEPFEAFLSHPAAAKGRTTPGGGNTSRDSTTSVRRGTRRDSSPARYTMTPSVARGTPSNVGAGDEDDEDEDEEGAGQQQDEDDSMDVTPDTHRRLSQAANLSATRSVRSQNGAGGASGSLDSDGGKSAGKRFSLAAGDVSLDQGDDQDDLGGGGEGSFDEDIGTGGAGDGGSPSVSARYSLPNSLRARSSLGSPLRTNGNAAAESSSSQAGGSSPVRLKSSAKDKGKGRLVEASPELETQEQPQDMETDKFDYGDIGAGGGYSDDDGAAGGDYDQQDESFGQQDDGGLPDIEEEDEEAGSDAPASPAKKKGGKKANDAAATPQKKSSKGKKAAPPPKAGASKKRAAPGTPGKEGPKRLKVDLKKGGADGDEDEDVRRSSRTRLEPVEYWRNERVIYNNRRRSIQDVIRYEPEPLPGFAHKTGHRSRSSRSASAAPKKGNKGKGRAAAAKEDSSSDEDEGVDDATEPDGVVWSWGNDAEETRRIAFTAKMVNPRPAGGAPFMFQKVFTELDYMAGGMLVIPSGGEKPTKTAKDNSYMFYCIEGAVSVTIHRTRFSVGPGGMFFVPRGNAYSILATSNRDVKLFFTQGRRVLEAPDGTAYSEPKSPAAPKASGSGSRK